MPKISIVLPSYNGEKYIRESIESVLKQTFSDWELIVVNDCSVDSTPEIAEEYEKKDARIRVIHNLENKKLPESLNIGFREAQGEFLTWTSDDNLYYPEALKTLYQYLEEHQEVPFVCADMEKINAEGESEGSFVLYDERKLFLNNCIGACFLYRRVVLEEVGEYDVTEFLVEDYDYWLRIKKCFGKLGYIPKCLYAYRFHENSLTTTREQKIREQLLRLRMKNIDWILENVVEKKVLCQIYYDFLLAGTDVTKFKQIIYNKVPELKVDSDTLEDNKKIIIYGAGKQGEQALRKFDRRVKYFSDGNECLAGTVKKGRVILSPEKLIELQKDYSILVAVGAEKVFEVLHFLYELGIGKCCVFQKV